MTTTSRLWGIWVTQLEWKTVTWLRHCWEPPLCCSASFTSSIPKIALDLSHTLPLNTLKLLEITIYLCFLAEYRLLLLTNEWNLLNLRMICNIKWAPTFQENAQHSLLPTIIGAHHVHVHIHGQVAWHGLRATLSVKQRNAETQNSIHSI